jgi:hypothetical protein
VDWGVVKGDWGAAAGWGVGWEEVWVVEGWAVVVEGWAGMVVGVGWVGVKEVVGVRVDHPK